MNKMSHNSTNQGRLVNQTFRLRDLIKPSFDLWVISWLLGLVTVISIVGLLMLSGWFLTATALAGMVALGSHSFNYMMPAAIIRMLAIARTAGRYGELMVSHNAIFNLLKELRVKFFSNLSQQPLSNQHQALQSSKQMHRLVSDIGILDSFNLRVVSPWLLSGIMMALLATFIMLLLPNITIAFKGLILLLMLSCLLLPAGMNFVGIKHAHKTAMLAEQRRNGLLAPLSILTQLLLWKQWQPQTQAFINQDETLQQLGITSQKHASIVMLIMQWLLYTVMAIILVAVALFYQNSTIAISLTDLNIPILLAVILGLFGIQEVIIPLGQHYLALGNSIAAKNRLNELLNAGATYTSDNGSQKNNYLPLPTTELIATLTQLNAKLPNALVGATNVNAKIQTGIPLIVTGASGCGKSTLLQTLSNELLPQSGEILLNGQAWQAYNWADQLGYLGQQLDIFDQSLADNLRLGNPQANDEELMVALAKVGLANWVNNQPQGLHTHLGEYGTAVSGGQARRICLARLLLKPRKVLLLDEPFAGLDSATRLQVWQAVREHQKNGLLVVVSHHHTWDNMGKVDRLDLGVGSVG